METLLQDRRICRGVKQVARRSANKKRQAKNSTAATHRNDFLNHNFQPLTDNKQLLKYQHEVETSYFNSLSNLAALYQFEPLNVDDKVYPYNIHLSYDYARRWMNIIAPDTKLVIISDEIRVASLATVKTFDTGTCLYYIPIKPVFKLLTEGCKQAELLLSVFAYLYQIVRVGYHSNDNSYLYYAYDAVETWTEEAQEEWNDDEFKEMQSEIRVHKFVAAVIERRIKHPYQLSCFEERVNGFVAADDFDTALLDIASTCLKLYKDYPERKIDDNIIPTILTPEEEDSIYVEQYLSFFWSSKGFLYDQVVEYINSSLQELSAIDEPTSIQFFDTPQTAITHEFYFEERFFKLLTDLIDLLIDME